MNDIPTTIKSEKLVQKRREQIIFAAIKLFSQKGFHKTTLRELAEEAGISAGNIYDYIGSKEDIFFLIHGHLARIAEEKFEQNIQDIEYPLDKLKEIIHTEFDLMYEWSDAILLIYQETHTLSMPRVKSILERERKHISKLEQVLEECIKKNMLRDCNTRIVANLITSMIDAWVLRRWDLRKQVTRTEMEKSILEIFFNGLLNLNRSESNQLKDRKPLDEKLILFINPRTELSKAILRLLLSKGARLAIHGNGTSNDAEGLFQCGEGSEVVKFYSVKKYGQMTPYLFKQIVDDFGSINVIIEDLGFSYSEATTSYTNLGLTNERLETSFSYVEEVIDSLEKSMSKTRSGRILYLAPWAWDSHRNSFQYEIVKAETIALTRAMAKRMAPSRINVNCIIPGFINGIKPVMADNGKETETNNLIPLGYIGDINDVMNAIYYFISDASKYITGQVLEVTGGLSLD